MNPHCRRSPGLTPFQRYRHSTHRKTLRPAVPDPSPLLTSSRRTLHGRPEAPPWDRRPPWRSTPGCSVLDRWHAGTRRWLEKPSRPSWPRAANAGLGGRAILHPCCAASTPSHWGLSYIWSADSGPALKPGTSANQVARERNVSPRVWSAPRARDRRLCPCPLPGLVGPEGDLSYPITRELAVGRGDGSVLTADVCSAPNRPARVGQGDAESDGFTESQVALVQSVCRRPCRANWSSSLTEPVIMTGRPADHPYCRTG